MLYEVITFVSDGLAEDREYVLDRSDELECLVYRDLLSCRVGIDWELLDVQRDAVVYEATTRFAHLQFEEGEQADAYYASRSLKFV